MSQNPHNGGFQLYTSLNALVVSKIPDSLSYNAAAVLPLAISTAAACLFKKEALALPLPKTSDANPPASGKSVLVWGGSSSVGATAIQLAAGAGHKVVSVASARNIENVKALGADAVFDFAGVQPTVTRDVQVYDSLGRPHDLTLSFLRTGAANQWTVEVSAAMALTLKRLQGPCRGPFSPGATPGTSRSKG